MARGNQGSKNGPSDRPPRPSEGPGSLEEAALQVMALISGSAAVVAMPLLVAILAGQAPVQLQLIVFAFPLALATVGRLRGTRWWEVAAASVAGALVLALVLQVGEIPLATTMIGALISLVVVGKYLLDHDRLGGGVWLACTSIALIVGFAGIAQGAAATAGAVSIVVLLGAAFALARMRRKRT